ncbi:hypothetical protein C1752_10372 [Acaryochloris thomasi RCC1774]|uniref:CHAT domain-containing protein n=1 Tax=Acaryochloris thomasi RCC1774 TaxID=1764569 RepID=A0A2W1JN19_9CYAN|nr:CHAT domain-containing protein [Acaryochloris thomasi]PZD70651.1 hypothetical protein C1752_10372 [Acaryochloris thomasi RCC1774]
MISKICTRPLLKVLFLTSLILSLLWAHGGQGAPTQQRSTNTANNNAGQLVQQGYDLYQSRDYQGAIERWQAALPFYQTQRDLANNAIVLENLARAHRHLGQTAQVLQHWQQVILLQRQLGNTQKVGRILTEQAQAYSQLGQHRRAIAVLCNPTPDCQAGSAIDIARHAKDSAGEAAALGSIGNAYLARGDHQQAIDSLEEGLALASKLPNYQTVMLSSLANAYLAQAEVDYRQARSENQSVTASRLNQTSPLSSRQEGNIRKVTALHQKAQDNETQALSYFKQSLSLSQQQDKPLTSVQTLLRIIPIYRRKDAFHPKVEPAKKKALNLIPRLPVSQEAVFAAIDLAHLYRSVVDPALSSEGPQCYPQETASQARSLLKQALKTAEQVGDRRSKSFALGELGHWYECRQDHRQALRITQKARWIAADLDSNDSLYLWEWQTGRILNAHGQTEESIKFYQRAVSTLGKIRRDILNANRDLQFDFRDNIEPLYRELVTLYLQQNGAESIPAPAQTQQLTKALNTLDSLKLAELQNYFGNDCALTALPATPVEQVGPAGTATLSTIILPQRSAVILTLPNGQRQLAWIQESKSTLQNTINDYRVGLERNLGPYTNRQSAEQLYQWLIQPFETALTEAQVNTLVFVQDGLFRTVPMAALFDGQQFLIERFAIATTPSLHLIDPQPLKHSSLKAMILGLTEAAQVDNQYFPALHFVASEVERIEAQFPRSKKLINDAFTRERLYIELSRRNYPIIHIATHARFSPEPENTFLVLGNNSKLTLSDFEQLLREVNSPQRAIDLLMLSACQTAVGDNRAALGLAGSAIQAGARSTLASLWFIDDQATAEFSEQFYQALNNPQFSKAQALQAAQLSLIKSGKGYRHPCFWAAFILIGNWL